MGMTDETFRVKLTQGYFKDPWPDYFDRFWKDCQAKARAGGWSPLQVANHELRPMGGKLITTNTQGWYLRWDDEPSHTAFILRWS